MLRGAVCKEHAGAGRVRHLRLMMTGRCQISRTSISGRARSRPPRLVQPGSGRTCRPVVSRSLTRGCVRALHGVGTTGAGRQSGSRKSPGLGVMMAATARQDLTRTGGLRRAMRYGLCVALLTCWRVGNCAGMLWRDCLKLSIHRHRQKALRPAGRTN